MTLELAALGAVLVTRETIQFTAPCEDFVMGFVKYRYNDLVCIVCISTFESTIPVHVTAGAAPAVSNRRSLIEMTRIEDAAVKFGESQNKTLMLTFVA
jgi:hypothetical protein